MWLTGFEFDLLLPHRYLDVILHSGGQPGSFLPKLPAEVISRLKRIAWKIIDDSFLGRASLFYSGSVLAFGAVILAAGQIGLQFPGVEFLDNGDGVCRVAEVCAELRRAKAAAEKSGCGLVSLGKSGAAFCSVEKEISRLI
jgi:hypothetical protein